MTHFLIVSGNGERDYDVEHPPECPREEYDPHVEDIPPMTTYLCEVGRAIALDGLGSLPGLDTLAPGRYEIEAWSEPGRWHGATWSDPDGGLLVVEDDEE